MPLLYAVAWELADEDPCPDADAVELAPLLYVVAWELADEDPFPDADAVDEAEAEAFEAAPADALAVADALDQSEPLPGKGDIAAAVAWPGRMGGGRA